MRNLIECLRKIQTYNIWQYMSWPNNCINIERGRSWPNNNVRMESRDEQRCNNAARIMLFIESFGTDCHLLKHYDSGQASQTVTLGLVFRVRCSSSYIFNDIFNNYITTRCEISQYQRLRLWYYMCSRGRVVMSLDNEVKNLHIILTFFNLIPDE